MHHQPAMSRLAGLLVFVLGATAFADPGEPPAAPAKTEAAAPGPKATAFPLRVVKILSDSEQALLFDKHRGRHVLVEVGDAIGDYTVSAIDADAVTLSGKELPVQIVLQTVLEAKPKPAVAKRTGATDAVPEDPYADAEAPADPYADEAEQPVRAVSATDGAPADEQPIRATHWGASDGTKSTSSPFAGMREDAAKPSDDVAKLGTTHRPGTDAAPHTDAAAAPAAPHADIAPPATPAAAEPAAPGTITLARAEVAAALKDFGALATSIDGSFVATGLAVERVKPGSVFAKAGLRVGDTVTAVDGRPLRTIDDAADLYARAGSMKHVTVQVVRAGKPQALHVAIR